MMIRLYSGGGQQGGKAQAMRRYLYDLWLRYKAGEDVGRPYVVGRGWTPPCSTTSTPREWPRKPHPEGSCTQIAVRWGKEGDTRAFSPTYCLLPHLPTGVSQL